MGLGNGEPTFYLQNKSFALEFRPQKSELEKIWERSLNEINKIISTNQQNASLTHAHARTHTDKFTLERWRDTIHKVFSLFCLKHRIEFVYFQKGKTFTSFDLKRIFIFCLFFFFPTLHFQTVFSSFFLHSLSKQKNNKLNWFFAFIVALFLQRLFVT